MTHISPFPGIRYNTDRIDNLADVISPPYDKIAPHERRIYWDRHESNVVRLILPPPDDAATDFATQESISTDWYAAAAERFHSWRESGLLIADSPQLYVYRQTFPYLGTTFTRTGLFVALQLEEQGGPLAHEHTFEGPKADRFRLTCAVQANLSPIFLLADGELTQWNDLFQQTGAILNRFEDWDNHRHVLVSIDDPSALQGVQEFVQTRTLVIADGHHRYETAQNYKRRMIQETGKNPQDEPWGYVLALIVPAASPDLLVLPTHRVIAQMEDGWLDHLRSHLEPYGSLEDLSDRSGESIRQRLSLPYHQASVAIVAKNRGFLFSLHPEAEPPSLKALPAPLRRLNVSILHQFILESCLNLTPLALQGITQYIRGEEEAISRIQTDRAQAAFLLGGLSPQTVLDVSQRHVRMPQKSTDFYPKIPTGLLFRSLVDSDR